jgi:Fe-S cluster biogenesis protein NfuA
MKKADAKSNGPQEDLEPYRGALAKLRPGFQADGMDLIIGSIDPTGTVDVKVVLGPNACEECLMPPEQLAKFFLAAVRKVTPNVTRVVVTVEGTAGGGPRDAGGTSCKLFPGGDLRRDG